jgi:uncharacterized protein (TIGR02145 family)
MINLRLVIVKSGTYLNILIVIFIFGGILFSKSLIAQDVKIGTQVWMSKNLDVDRFRNGEIISQAKNYEAWKFASDNKIAAWCYYDFDSSYGVKYGKLYNLFAVSDARGIAPEGYHIPSVEEWSTLINFLGGDSIAGKKMKSQEGWNSCSQGKKLICSNCQDWSESYKEKTHCTNCKNLWYLETWSGNGDNSSGFNAQGGGKYDWGGFFVNLSAQEIWWSYSISNPNSSRTCGVVFSSDTVYVSFEDDKYHAHKKHFNGYSVRCVLD